MEFARGRFYTFALAILHAAPPRSSQWPVLRDARGPGVCCEFHAERRRKVGRLPICRGSRRLPLASVPAVLAGAADVSISPLARVCAAPRLRANAQLAL